MSGLPLATRMYNLVGGLAPLTGRGPRLDLDSIVALGHEIAQLDDEGDPYHRPALEALCASAEQADLTFMGRRWARDLVALSLAGKMMLQEVRRAHPNIFERPIAPSFLVMGFARTGTTHLHRLLALDPRFQGIPKWQVQRPIPFPLVNPEMIDDRRERAIQDQEVAAKYFPDKDAVHFSDVDSPEECSVMLLRTFTVSLFWSRLPVYDYADWLMANGITSELASYRDHRALLQIISHHRGDDSGFALKAPDHTPALTGISEVLPEAMIVHTHRDPVTCSTSLHSMVEGNHRLVASKLDLPAMAEVNLRLMTAGLRHHLEARQRYGHRVMDVGYRDIVDNPIRLVRSIYERFEVDWPEGHEQRLQAYLDANPKDKHGRHRYRPEDYGLRADDVKARFADYLDRFPEAR